MSEWMLAATTYFCFAGKAKPPVTVRARFDRDIGEAEPESTHVSITIDDEVTVDDPKNMGKIDDCLIDALALADRDCATYAAHRLLQAITHRSRYK
ncbi:MAG: hypothetical protein QF486_05080 [Candidatus Woesearchaeota archaeon]|nr:hypothetical protein [Candidatus Woesearchaeota archaeon]MDP7181987.1 hypothetical protein [Candidatus Woesearchaeota archaeon]MDP7198961.1 hypothetical protein [Candidatus Woesearchaeota archaeon]MDP7467341.1 hypothetical protein [Candidatus Woesearchaeota archaeon]MDP7646605.1 hypothetical protein [Candidatus Woesearchaeota archaeon]